MSVENIGTTIARRRKEKGSTQEDLAIAVGVSAQAVSKWERGGVPDVELLPAIADYFGVSIDSLFGRQIGANQLEQVLAKKVIDTPKEERLRMLFSLSWVIEKALFGIAADNNEGGALEENIAAIGEGGNRNSCYLSDHGFTYMRLGEGMPYFFLSPEKYLDMEILKKVNLCALFSVLAQEDALRALLMLYQRPNDKFFTPQLLVNELGISAERAEEILVMLKNYGHLSVNVLGVDDGEITMYRLMPQPPFVALLMFARECINRPHNFTYYMGGRGEPYLK